jgi:hypothetical protein
VSEGERQKERQTERHVSEGWRKRDRERARRSPSARKGFSRRGIFGFSEIPSISLHKQLAYVWPGRDASLSLPTAFTSYRTTPPLHSPLSCSLTSLQIAHTIPKYVHVTRVSTQVTYTVRHAYQHLFVDSFVCVWSCDICMCVDACINRRICMCVDACINTCTCMCVDTCNHRRTHDSNTDGAQRAE